MNVVDDNESRMREDAMLLVEWEGVNVVDDNESRIGSLTRVCNVTC